MGHVKLKPSAQTAEVGSEATFTVEITNGDRNEFELTVNVVDATGGALLIEVNDDALLAASGAINKAGLKIPVATPTVLTMVTLKYRCTRPGTLNLNASVTNAVGGTSDEARSASRSNIALFVLNCTGEAPALHLPYEFVALDGDGRPLGCLSPDNSECEVIPGVSQDNEFPGPTDCATQAGTVIISGGTPASPYLVRFSAGNWENITPSETYGITLTHIVGGNDVWVAGGQGGAMVSSDLGITWTQSTLITQVNWLAYGDGKFFTSDVSSLFNSTDGLAWVDNGAVLGGGRPLTMAWSGPEWVAITSIVAGSGAHTYTSPDGETWTQKATISGADIRKLAFGNGIYVAVGATGIIRSIDGLSWSQSAPPNTGQMSTVTYNEAKGTFLAGGPGAKLFRSTDGAISWVEVLHPSPSDFLNVQGLCTGR